MRTTRCHIIHPFWIAITAALVLWAFLFAACVKQEEDTQNRQANVTIEIINGTLLNGKMRSNPLVKILIEDSGDAYPCELIISSEEAQQNHVVLTNWVNNIPIKEPEMLHFGQNSVQVAITKYGEEKEFFRQKLQYDIVEVQEKMPAAVLTIDNKKYAPGALIQIETGNHQLQLTYDPASVKRCSVQSKTAAISRGLTITVDDKNGIAYGALKVPTPANGEIVFTLENEYGEWDLSYQIEVVIPSPTPVITLTQLNDVAFRPDFICLQGKIMDFRKSEHSVDFALGGHSVNGVVHDDGTFKVEAESRPLEPGRYAFTVKVIDSSNGTVVDTKSFPVYVMDFSPALYEQGTWTENWNRCIQRGIGKTYVLKVETGASANIKATATNGTTGSVSSGYFTQDGMALLFPLKDDGVALGPQVLTVAVYGTDGNPITSREVTITGWDSYCCKYTIDNNTVFSKLSGPKQSFPFALHFSVSAYLVGVIPYTEAITIGNQHYNKEVFEFVNIDSIGLTFDQAAGESFTTKSIFSSSYLRYAGTYLNGELKKIHVAHTATRWKDDGTVESYWPTPYLQAEIIYKHTRNDGDLLPEYWEIVYNDENVKKYLQGLGVVTKIYHAN